MKAKPAKLSDLPQEVVFTATQFYFGIINPTQLNFRIVTQQLDPEQVKEALSLLRRMSERWLFWRKMIKICCWLALGLLLGEILR